ncbi:hypothetical protein MPER_08690, partial [Moniliophthora perniciosa FA553]
MLGNLWLNSRTGRVSTGPDGPSAPSQGTEVLYKCENMPSAMEMATADTCVTFFKQTGAGNLDRDVLQYANGQSSRMCIECLLGIDSPDDHAHKGWLKDTRRGVWVCGCGRTACDEVRDFIGKLRLDTVYSGVRLDKIAVLKENPAYTWWTSSSTLSDQTRIDNGLMRFRFHIGSGSEDTSSGWVFFDKDILQIAWLSQAHRLNLPSSGSET